MISVIIPTYKAPEALDICIQSALSNQLNDNQIIVVVDGFYDLNKDVLNKYDDQIHVLDLETNHGLCKATNLGVYNAQFDKILIVNDDNVFPPEWDELLLEDFTQGRVITPNQIEPTPSIFDEMILKSFGEPEHFDMEGFNKFSSDCYKNELTNKGSTLPIFMSKRDYLTVGGWDESYPGAWVVDWEFFHKCDLAGYELVRSLKCHFYHFVSYGTESTPQEQVNKRLKEQDCHKWFKYKWGFYPRKNNEDYKLWKQ